MTELKAGKPELKGIQDKRKVAALQLLESTNLLSQGEMRKAFNLGIGMILVISKDNADKVLEMLKEDKALVIGDIG